MKCDHKDTEGERRECRRLLKLGTLHLKTSSDALYQVESFLEREATYEITGEEVRCLERPFSYLPWWPWPICRVWGTGLKVANYYRLWERIDPNDLSHYLPDGIHYLPPGYHSLGKGLRKAFAHAGWVPDTSSVEEEKSDVAFEPILEFCRTGEVGSLLGALEEMRNGEALERQSVAMELNDVLRDPEDCVIEEESHGRLSTEVMALFFPEEEDGLSFEPISPEAYEKYEAEISGYLGRDVGSLEARIGELESLDEAWEWSESSGRGGRRENMTAIRDAIAVHMSEYSWEDRTLLLQAIDLREHRLEKLEEAVLSVEGEEASNWLSDIAFERQLLESLSNE